MKKILEKLKKLRGNITHSSPLGAGADSPDGEQFVTKMKKLGFTLAEVLVVVAIIGVISMIMIRVWHGSIDGQEFDTGVQKMISRLSQALRMNRVTHDFENWNDIFGKNGGDNIQRDLLDRNLKVVKVDDGNDIAKKYADGKFFNYSAGENKVYTLKDGIQYSLFQNEDETILIENEPVKVIMVIDVNGTRKGPNTPGKDVRMLALTVNRADEFKGGEDWCGDECVTLNGEQVKASVLPAELMNRTEAYYNCSQQGKQLASAEDLESLLTTSQGRTAAGTDNTYTTCYNTRNKDLVYVCYNPQDDSITRGYRTWANDQQLSTVWHIGSPDIPNRSDNNLYLRGVCIEDKALAQAKAKYPNANPDGVLNGTPYKLVSRCLDSDDAVRTAARCSASAWQDADMYTRDTWDYAKEFCEKNGMTLPDENSQDDVDFLYELWQDNYYMNDYQFKFWAKDAYNNNSAYAIDPRKQHSDTVTVHVENKNSLHSTSPFAVCISK